MLLLTLYEVPFKIESMRNLIVLALLVVGVGGLIYWLWSGSGQNEEVVDFAAMAPATEDTGRARPGEADPTLSEVEISVDSSGLVIDRLYGKQLDLLVTRNEVKDVAVLDGIMTFSELEDGNWNFKAINLEQYIEQYLK